MEMEEPQLEEKHGRRKHTVQNLFMKFEGW
jgi:hypothetical protein